MKKYFIILILSLIIFTIGFASADENVTGDVCLSDEVPITESVINESSQTVEPSKVSTKIETSNVMTYYKEKSELVGYLKDSDNNPISNKKVSISVNNNNYNRITDSVGKVVLKLNLKPGTYSAKISFAGDDNYTASSAKSVVKVKNAHLSIKTANYKTYFESGFYFKAKVVNKVTNNPVEGIKVAFKVYHDNKYKTYFATTDANGIVKLRKNLNVGTYKIVTSIKKNKYFKSNKSKANLTVKETKEFGCTSLYVQVSNTEAVAAFRRDTTNARALNIVKYKLAGKTTVKQYKTGTYFFHIAVSADGWMAGTGGADNPTINRAIEKLAGKMFKSGKINRSYLKKIQGYEKRLGIGHFSIKAPNGKYAVVWASGIYTGKLKPGEYIKVPNAKYLFRYGTWAKFSKNPAKAAIKIAAKDSFGVNRRDATAFHWKASTNEGKTTSSLKVYAANDNGRLVGRSTAHLADNIYFKGKFISKNSLPKTPYSKFLGTYKFGNIDKIIKTQTTVSAPKLTKTLNETSTLNIIVKDKKTKKPIKNLKLKIKIGEKVFTVKTNNKGVAKFNPKSLDAGMHKLSIYTDNIKYKVSAKSTIEII